MWTAYEVLSDKDKRRQYDQFGAGSFDGTAHSANFHDIFRSNAFFNDNDDDFFNSRQRGQFPGGFAFNFDSAFDGFDRPGFDFDAIHKQHHERFHRNAQRGAHHGQFHQQHQNMHRAAHDAARQRSTTFRQQSSGKLLSVK